MKTTIKNRLLFGNFFILIGGLKEFCRDYQNLCENVPVNICQSADFPPSPTTCEPVPGRPQGTPVTAILPYLYLGNEEGAADEALIDRLSIKYILNLTPRCPNFFSQRPDIHYKQIKIHDSNQEDIGQHFDEAIQFIGKLKYSTSLVRIGKRRSGRNTSDLVFELSANHLVNLSRWTKNGCFIRECLLISSCERCIALEQTGILSHVSRRNSAHHFARR